MMISNALNNSIQGEVNQKFILGSLIASALVYPFWGVTPQYLLPGADDSLLGRFVASAISIFGLFLLRFGNNKEIVEDLASLGSFSVVLHYLYLCYLNDYHNFYVSGAFIVIVSLLSTLVSRGTVIIFFLLSLLGAGGCLLAEIPQERSVFFLLGVFTVGSIVSFLTFFRIEVLKKLDRANVENEENKKIAYHKSKLASLGILAAGVGHEINNPLSVIKGHVVIVIKSLEREKVDVNILQKSMQKIEIATDRIATIIKGLKTYSRADTAELEPFNISDMILETLDLVRSNYKIEGIDIKTSILNSVFVNGNRGRLQQVLMNLLSNAKDAIKEEPKVIKVILWTENGLVRVYVNDTGEGISEDIIDKIFEPFFTSKGVNEGTGLGLGISNQIIEEHQGRLIVENTGPDGTSFMIELKEIFV